MPTTTTTTNSNPLVKLIGWVTILAGVLLIAAGGGTWALVTTQLKAESITVAPGSGEAPGKFTGKTVAGPITAFAQAEAIKSDALAGAGGRTYAELGEDIQKRTEKLKGKGATEQEIAADDEVVALTGQRTGSQTGAFLRASLLTSVISYGVAALVIGLGLLFALLGIALRTGSTTTTTTVTPAAKSAPAETDVPVAAQA